MRTPLSSLSPFLLLPLLAGCTGYTIRHDGAGPGYDVYRPEPYLLLVNGARGPDASIVYLPDHGNRFRIHTWNVLGKADYQFEIEDGWRLEGISDKSDNTKLATALLDIVEKATPAGALAALGTDPVTLFKLIHGEDGSVVGLAPLPADLVLADHVRPVVPD
jgi:hypothetical protein